MNSIISPEVYVPLTTVGCVLAGFLNFIAVPLSIYASKYSLGSFKIIMLVFSTTNMLHYIVDTFTHPRFFFMRYLAVVYSSGPVKLWSQTAATFFVTWLCVIFMLQVFMEALHFLYRYIVLCRDEYVHLLSVKNVCKLLAISYFLFALAHSLNFAFNADFDAEVYNFIGNDSLWKRNIPAHDLHGIAFLYATKNEFGEYETRWRGSFGMTFLIGCNTFLLGTMMVCGFKIHRCIRTKFYSHNMSPSTLDMHETLFRMLIVQTVVPLFLLHTPCAIVLLGPVFFTIGKEGDLLMIPVLLYPIFEPLVVIYYLNKGRIRRTLRIGKSSISAIPSAPPSVDTSGRP